MILEFKIRVELLNPAVTSVHHIDFVLLVKSNAARLDETIVTCAMTPVSYLIFYSYQVEYDKKQHKKVYNMYTLKISQSYFVEYIETFDKGGQKG